MKAHVILMFLVGAAGCGPIALQHGARPVGAGKVAAGASTSIVHERGQGSADDSTVTQIAQPGGFVRYGVTDRVDAGVQVYQFGARADVKILLVESDEIVVSLDPGVHLAYYTSSLDEPGGFSTSDSYTSTGVDAALIVGWRVGQGEVFAAPRFGYFGFEAEGKNEDPDFGTDSYSDRFWARGWGASIGARLPVGSGKVFLIPELGIYQREIHLAPEFTHRALIWAPGIGFAAGF